MALFRALESGRRPAAARLPLVGGAVARLIDRRWPGARTSAVARTRLIDDAVLAALAEGVGQVLILGAGFDCRAYRLPGIERARVFEIDHPATSAAKRTRLAALLDAPPSHVTFVAVDFDRQPLLAALDAAGCDRTVPSLVVWEGVSNYLAAAAVDATLRDLATFAAGSRILFTYVHRGVLDGSVPFVGAERIAATVQRAGEPWTFGLDPTEVPAYLAARGLALVDDVGADEYRARLLGDAGRGYAFYRVVQARVAGDHGHGGAR